MNENDWLYRRYLKKTINVLSDSEVQLFEATLNLLMTGELREINEVFEIGDDYEFNINHFKMSDDINIKQMCVLIEKLRETVEFLMNVNNIKENDLSGD